MKKNKIMIIAIFLMLLAATAGTTYYFVNVRCVLDGDSVCYDNELEAFGIEEDTKLLIQVENEELGDYLVETWNSLHPENKGAISFKVQEALSLSELAEGFPYDVMLTNQNNASYFLNDLRDLGKDFDEVVGSKIPSQLEDAINLQGYYFVQNSIDGWYFVYNETLLEEMGFSMEADRQYGLPTSLNSWEKIFQNSDKILQDADYVFPLTFDDQLSFYPFLTGGRWTLNFSHIGSDPGFDSREFREGLELIELFSNSDISKKERDLKESTDKKTLPWMYEEAFYNRETPLTMLHSSMQFESYKEKTDDVYRIAPFPTYKEHHLSAMGEVNGYMVSQKAMFPSASAEVLRILRTPKAITVYKSADGKIPVYSRNHFDDLDLEEDLMRKIFAYNYHDTPSVLALDNNPDVLTRSLYDEVNFMDIFENLYLKKINIEEAQIRAVDRVDAWLNEHDISDDGVDE